MKTINGNELKSHDKRHVLAAYIYRNTIENIKSHADCVKSAGSSLPPITDEQWLAQTRFAVTKSGELDKRAPMQSITSTTNKQPNQNYETTIP